MDENQLVTGPDSAAQFLLISRQAISEALEKIDWIEGLSRQGLVDNALMIEYLSERLSLGYSWKVPEGLQHEPQVIAYREWLSSGFPEFNKEVRVLYESIPPDLRERFRITSERLKRSQLPEDWLRSASEAREQYDGESGLERLESLLQLPSHGEQSERIAAIVAIVGRLVAEWEGVTPTALRSYHDVISALFTVTDHVALSSYTSGGYLPDCWWARLALAIDEGLYDRMVKQIHRETRAWGAEGTIREERSMGGKAKAANAKPNPEKQQAIDYAIQHPGLSALQIKTRAKLRASERTIRSWLSAAC